MARRATGAWLVLLGAAVFAGTFVGAFAPNTDSQSCHHPLCHDGCHHRWRRGRTEAMPLRLPPLAVSKKEKEIKAEEKRRVRELAALQRKAERAELQRGLEDAMAAGDGLAARNLLRETARGDNPDHAEDPHLVSIAIRACSAGGRHADVLELYDVLSGSPGPTSTAGGELDAALIASASTDQWQRADQFLAALLQEVPRRWADDDLLRTSALATAAQSGKQSGAVAMILEGVVPTSHEAALAMEAYLKAKDPLSALAFYKEEAVVAQLGAKPHALALDALLAVTVDPKQRDHDAAQQAVDILNTLRSTSPEMSDVEAAAATETTVNIVVASGGGAQLAFELLSDESFGNHPASAATISAVIEALDDADYGTKATSAFEVSAFVQDPNALTLRARKVLVRVYGIALYGSEDLSAVCSLVVSNEPPPGDVSFARRVLDTMSLDDMTNTDVQEANTAFDFFALAILVESNQPRALDFSVEALSSFPPEGAALLLKALSFDVGSARAMIRERYGPSTAFLDVLSRAGSTAQASGAQLSRDVVHKLLLNDALSAHQEGLVFYLEPGGLGADAYLDIFRVSNLLCAHEGGLFLDAWWMAMQVAASAGSMALIDVIEREASNSGMELWDGEDGLFEKMTAVDLREHTTDTEELWKWEVYLSRARATTLDSFRPPYDRQVVRWFDPKENAALSEIIHSDTNRLGGFLEMYHQTLTLQCGRRDCLRELIGRVAEGELINIQVEGSVPFDLVGAPFWKGLLNPNSAISPLRPQLVNGDLLFGFSQRKACDPFSLISDMEKLNPYDCGLRDEFSDWARSIVKIMAKQLKRRSLDDFRQQNSDPPDYIRELTQLLFSVEVIVDAELKELLREEVIVNFDENLRPFLSGVLSEVGPIPPDLGEALEDELSWKETWETATSAFVQEIALEASTTPSHLVEGFEINLSPQELLIDLFRREETKEKWKDRVGSLLLERTTKQQGPLDEDTQQALLEGGWLGFVKQFDQHMESFDPTRHFVSRSISQQEQGDSKGRRGYGKGGSAGKGRKGKSKKRR